MYILPLLREDSTAEGCGKYQTVIFNIIIEIPGNDRVNYIHTYVKPTKQICRGALSQGILTKRPLLSSEFMMIGGMTDQRC